MVTMPAILFEDNHLLALNKPAGWLVQGDATGDPTLTDWGKAYLKEKYAKPGAVFLHPVHRLDRPVSGGVLLARTSKALERLNAAFREREVGKTYLALTLHPPRHERGELRHFLWKDEARNVVRAVAAGTTGAKEALLRYEYAGMAGPYHLLRIFPLTGRPHQIRVQLAAMGCVITGDLKYGAKAPLPDASIGLHCWQMTFEHPVRKEVMMVQAPFPDQDWWRQVAV